MVLPLSYKDVLVVDDDKYIRDMLADLLEDEGYTIDGVTNGQEALNYLHKQAMLPRLILLDLNMPIMSGWEFRAAQLKDAFLAHIPVVVDFGCGSEDVLAARITANRYVSKPLNLNLLLTIVEQYVRGTQIPVIHH